MTQIEVIGLIAGEIERSGGQVKFAARMKHTQPYISAMLHGRRMPSKRILKLLGLTARIIIVYEGGLHGQKANQT